MCKKLFMLVYDIGRDALRNITVHVKQHGATPRTHGNKGRIPKHALKYEDVRKVVQFIINYADEYGLPQPAAPRGRDNIAPIYIPAGTTKAMVHSSYRESCEESIQRAIKKSAFYNIWNSVLAHIKIATPRDDVCAACLKFRKHIIDAVTEQEKLDSADKMKEHVMKAQTERTVYN